MGYLWHDCFWPTSQPLKIVSSKFFGAAIPLWLNSGAWGILGPGGCGDPCQVVAVVLRGPRIVGILRESIGTKRKLMKPIWDWDMNTIIGTE